MTNKPATIYCSICTTKTIIFYTKDCMHGMYIYTKVLRTFTRLSALLPASTRKVCKSVTAVCEGADKFIYSGNLFMAEGHCV